MKLNFYYKLAVLIKDNTIPYYVLYFNVNDLNNPAIWITDRLTVKKLHAPNEFFGVDLGHVTFSLQVLALKWECSPLDICVVLVIWHAMVH